MKPNLFILGAPKCGTTALAKWLSAHPQVFVSPVKEPHYFCEEYRLTPSLERYEALFKGADPGRHSWACEASVWHLFSDTAVPNILAYAPDARFVVMVRNPLEMAPSMHEQQRFNGNELVTDFALALALNEARCHGEHAGMRPEYLRPEHLAYLRSCALGWQLQRLLARVSPDRIHVIVHDDMKRDPAATYACLLDFLGVEHVMPTAFERVNAAKQRKSFLFDALVLRLSALKRRVGITRRLNLLRRLRRWNVTYRERDAQAAEVQASLRAAYAEDVILLESLLERDLSHWLSVGEDASS